MMTSFARVIELLNKARDDWAAANNRPPRLRMHGSTFGWDSYDKLIGAKAMGMPLIAPETMTPGKGNNANLVIALRVGVSGFPRMPNGGPYLIEQEIDEIADWISAGAKPDAPAGLADGAATTDKPAGDNNA